MKTNRIVLAACVAVFLSPLLYPYETVDLDDFEAWAFKGPHKEDHPFAGVFLFQGLNPVLLPDTSYAATRWDPASHTLDISFAAPGAVVMPRGTSAKMGKWADTSAPPPLEAGQSAMRFFSVTRYGVRLYLSQNGTWADIAGKSCFELPVVGARCYPGPLSAETLVASMDMQLASDGVWHRNSYVPRGNTSGYLLKPVFTKAKGLNRANLALAKEKLMGGEAIRLKP